MNKRPVRMAPSQDSASEYMLASYVAPSKRSLGIKGSRPRTMSVVTTNSVNSIAPTAVYVWAGGEVVANLTSGYYYFYDGRGNVSHLTDSGNVLIERYTYDLNGSVSYFDANNTPITASSVGNRFLFAGAILLPETSLYDMRNRVYFPRWGRFLQTDPIGFKGDPSNLYRYCGNDPVDRTDPTGLDCLEVEFTATSTPVRSEQNDMSGHVYHGMLRWFDDSGKIVRVVPVASGGYKEGGSRVRGKETKILDGRYRATRDLGDRGRDMKVGAVGFSIELVPNFKRDPKNYQTELRIHPDGGPAGTHACIGLATDEKGLKDFRKAFQEYVKEHGPIPVDVQTAASIKPPPEPLSQAESPDFSVGVDTHSFMAQRGPL
jgi:RHS repeat-associated protein